MLSPFFVLFFCNPGPHSQILPHAASIDDKLRSLARRSSPQWRRKVRVCRLAYRLAYAQEFARKRRYFWVQVDQVYGSDSATSDLAQQGEVAARQGRTGNLSMMGRRPPLLG